MKLHSNDGLHLPHYTSRFVELYLFCFYAEKIKCLNRIWIWVFALNLYILIFLQQNGKGWAAWLCIWPFGTAWELSLYNGVNFVCHTTNCKILLFLFLKVKERYHPCIYPMVMNVSMNPLVKTKSKERFCTTKIFFFIMNACIT